eukprot:CAMPEP_0201694330 /NCGR_PEP_ID=MMETSP0578-20130828/6647_1 /ASSEMBLY_ACC=CAM_ASM_000663 /TAXON_ID=267565 /ORGANISM="Skeletonema grethea, Strain CCMP 1804" /LENGTH=75 /DNA_ID=CAMNT_0048180003 /DNA_START=155 /DNA_END=382 /DNA_ORIENTATION=-
MTRALEKNGPKSPPTAFQSPLRSVENEMNMILDEDFSFKPMYSILGEEESEQWSCHYLLKDGAVARVLNPLAKSR